MVRCATFLCAHGQFSAIPLPFGSTSAARSQKHSHPVNVVRQVAQADFRPCSSYPDRAQQHVSGSLSLHAKDVLDPRTDFSPCLVSVLFSWRQLTMTVPLTLDMFAKTVLRQAFQPVRRSISRIRPELLLVLSERICSKTWLSCWAASVTA